MKPSRLPHYPSRLLESSAQPSRKRCSLSTAKAITKNAHLEGIRHSPSPHHPSTPALTELLPTLSRTLSCTTSGDPSLQDLHTLLRSHAPSSTSSYSRSFSSGHANASAMRAQYHSLPHPPLPIFHGCGPQRSHHVLEVFLHAHALHARLLNLPPQTSSLIACAHLRGMAASRVVALGSPPSSLGSLMLVLSRGIGDPALWRRVPEFRICGRGVSGKKEESEEERLENERRFVMLQLEELQRLADKLDLETPELITFVRHAMPAWPCQEFDWEFPVERDWAADRHEVFEVLRGMKCWQENWEDWEEKWEEEKEEEASVANGGDVQKGGVEESNCYVEKSCEEDCQQEPELSQDEKVQVCKVDVVCPEMKGEHLFEREKSWNVCWEARKSGVIDKVRRWEAEHGRFQN